MYVKFFPEDLNPDPYLSLFTKHLYLWSDHRTKNVQWYFSYF